MEVDKELDHKQFHPLEDTWTLWFQKQNESGSTSAIAWLEGLKEVMSFGTVEEFWQMYNNIKTPTDMPHQTDYCVFKEGIEPKWEDPEHKVGGYFTLSLQGIEPEIFNKMWLHSLLACIGADFGHDEYETITGLYLSIRKKGSKISVWCRSPDHEQCQRVGERFQELLDELNQNGKLHFNFTAFNSVNTSAGGYKPKGERKGGYKDRDNRGGDRDYNNRDNNRGGDRDYNNRDNNKREFNRDYQNRGKESF